MAAISRFYSWIRPKSIDEDFLESYRKLLFSQYASLPNDVPNPQAKAEGDRIYNMPHDEIDWGDLYQLELAIIKLEPVELLRRRIWILRNEYKEVATAEELKDYLASSPPDPHAENVSDVILRADAVRLQEELNWRYVVLWVFETFRGHIIKSLVRAATVLLVVTLLVICFWQHLYSWFSAVDLNFPVIAMTIVPGILGGLISTLRRVQQARLGGNADADLSELQDGKLGIYLSPLLGGIFALLLFFLFAGGFLNGGLFPKVSFDSLVPSEGAVIEYAEVAKLIVWSFIAGFAERFVPDQLERFTKESNSSSSNSSKQK